MPPDHDQAGANSDSMDDRLDRALEDVEAGRVETFDNDEDFMASLDESPAATTGLPFSEPVCFGYCGNLQWTIEQHGRVTHKAMCPRRTEPWCQSHPSGCPSDCQAIGSRERL